MTSKQRIQLAVGLGLIVSAAIGIWSIGVGPIRSSIDTSSAPKVEPDRERPLLINGAGSTFVNPLFAKWFREYNLLKPGIEVNYQSIGSGGGVRQLKKSTVTFAATDTPLTEQDLASFKEQAMQFPVILGAVALTYNLPNAKTPLKLTGPILAAIARGQIKKWNDPELVRLNPDQPLPNQEIVFVYRSDSSGTTGVFTDYLNKQDPRFAQEIGVGKSVQWATGIGGKGNEGVTAHVKNIEGSLGYLELTYALSQNLGRALIRNSVGEFIEANLESVTLAANSGSKKLPADFAGSITDPEGKGVYPIAAFSYVALEIPKTVEAPFSQMNLETLKLLVWALGESAQHMAREQGFAPLPEVVRLRTLERVTCVLNRSSNCLKFQ